MSELTFRQGRASDLEAVYELGETAWDQSRRARGLIGDDQVRTEQQLPRQLGSREAALGVHDRADGAASFLVCEDGDQIVGYVVVSRFPGMDEMAELLGGELAPARA